MAGSRAKHARVDRMASSTDGEAAGRTPLRQGRIGAILALAIVAALWLAPSEALARSFWIERFDATLMVEPDGTLRVTESIRFGFEGSYRGIYREIPVEYRTEMGFDYDLRLRVVSVTDDAGSALRHEVSRDDGLQRIKVWVPGAEDAQRTVVLDYAVERALRHFPEHDQLYWNVTGTEWPVPIRGASAVVVLPEGLDEEPRIATYVGGRGSREQGGARVENLTPNQVRIETTRPLEFNEGLTIVVGWPKGLIEEPTALDRAGWLLADNWPLGIPLVVLGLMTWVWSRRGRDPRIDRSVMPVYEPPEGLTPAEIGTLVDERVDQRDLAATVVDLAVRGWLRIEEIEEPGLLWGTSTETTFRRLEDPAEDELAEHERRVLDGLFEEGDVVEMSDLKNRFYEHLDEIREALYERLSDGGYFQSRPDRVRKLWLAGGIALAAIGGFLVLFLGVAGIVAAVASGLIVVGFSFFMPARSRQGRRAWVGIKGFEEFLGRTEGQRLRAMGFDADRFERYLPHAMALGVAENWAKAFEGMLEKPPDWYTGPHAGGAFSSSRFGSRLSSLSSSLGTAMASAPRSSSGSSGFSGGGFSGGGFGGGGGGAF